MSFLGAAPIFFFFFCFDMFFLSENRIYKVASYQVGSRVILPSQASKGVSGSTLARLPVVRPACPGVVSSKEGGKSSDCLS